MIKKTTKAITFFALLQVIIYSCCNNTYDVYYESVNFFAVDTDDFDASTVDPENLELNLDFIYDYIQISHLKELNQLSNSAYATTCDDDYFFKDTILSITITANETIFGVEAGESINDHLLFVNPNTLNQERIEDMVVFLNNQDGNRFLTLILNEVIPSDTILSFSINIELDRNRSLESTTDLITIE